VRKHRKALLVAIVILGQLMIIAGGVATGIMIAHQKPHARLHWVADVIDETGAELGTMYRWENDRVCLLANYDNVLQKPCPE